MKKKLVPIPPTDAQPAQGFRGLTREEVIKVFEIVTPDLLLIELDVPPEMIGQLHVSEQTKRKMENCVESAVVVKKYIPLTDEDIASEYPRFNKFFVGDRVSFMNYAAPRGPFPNFPKLRVIGMNDIMAILHTDKTLF